MTPVRPATAADIPAIAAVLAATGEPIGWPDLPGYPYLEHLIVRARVVVVEDDGGVAGFAGSIDIGGARFLTDLFVDPARQQRGAGRALLDAALDGATARMTFSSADDRALGLYIRAGMRPWWTLLYLVGSVSGLGPRDPGMTVEAATVEATAGWSRTWTGVDRTVDFAHYATLPDADGFAVRLDGAVAAVGWARRARTSPGRWIDHVSIAPDADSVAATIAAWHAAAPDGGRVTACVPGPHPAIATLLDGGIRIVDRDPWCASDPDLVDPVRLLPNPGFL